MPIHNYRVVDERIELYRTFKNRAKKSIRYFCGDEIIYPVLMLAVINEKNIMEHNFKFLYKNAEIIDKLQKIYKITHNLEIEIERDFVKVPSKNTTTKQKVLFSIFSIICCLIMSFVGVGIGFIKNYNGLGTASAPIKITTGEEFITAIEFGNRNYTLKNDIEISGSEFTGKNFSGTILGNGHTVSVNGEITTSLINNLSGKIENLKIKLVSNDVKITQNWAVLAENSSGIIQNCKVYGEIKGDFNSTEEIFSGVITSKNTGKILGSEVEIVASLKNSNQSNAYFGGIAGVNEGEILDCAANSGKVVADTVDLAGIACQNYGTIFNTKNSLALEQTSDKEWHPNIAGVSIANYGTIEQCKNHAELNASSLTDNDTENNYYVFIGGISCENYGSIKDCRNTGTIFASGKIANIVVGGAVSQNIDNDEGFVGTISSTLSKSNINAVSEKGHVCVGGLVGLNATSVVDSGFVGTIDADSKATESKDVFVSKVERVTTVFAGGVVGISQYSEIKNCYADVSYLADGNIIVEPEEDDSQKLYAGIVGSIGIYAYVETVVVNPFYPDRQYLTDAFTKVNKNYYVAKTEISESAYGVFGTTNNWTYVGGVIVALTDEVLAAYFDEGQTMFAKCLTFDDIPLEVLDE